MQSPVIATSADETPVFFSANGNVLSGILTRPTVTPRGSAVVAAWGGGMVGSTGRNRVWVRLCRRLAAEGFHAFRFDFHGVGDSTGEVDGFRLEEPFVEDLAGAVRWMEGKGISRFILAGWCFGARTALACAPDLSGLEGLVLVSPPLLERGSVRSISHLASQVSVLELLRKGLRPWVLRGFWDPNRRRRYVRFARAKWRTVTAKARRGASARDQGEPVRISASLLEQLEHIVRRRVPTLFLYGTADPEYQGLQAAMSGPLGELLERAGSRMEISTLPGRLHNVGRVSLQDAAIDAIERWVCRRN
jgi:pimeloyl-ACP methyl ester carboxylesterase